MIEVGWYEHYKGAYYYVFGEGIQTETRERLVIYKAPYDSVYQARPYDMFFEEVEPGVKRFKKL
jgi:hypothetical protein